MQEEYTTKKYTRKGVDYFMSKLVIGSFSNVQETTACVEQLIAEGHAINSIKIVTTNQDPSVIKNQTGVETDTVSTEQEDEKSSWSKFKTLFVDTDDNLMLENYGVEQSVAARYNESLKNGEYIVLADENNGLDSRGKGTVEPNESTVQSTEASSGMVGQAGEGVREVRNASEPTDEETFANDGDDRLNNAEVPLENDFTNQGDLNGNINATSDLTDTTVPETIEEDNAMEDSIRNDNKPRLQDNRDSEVPNGGFSKEQDRRDDTRDVVTPEIDPLNHQEYDPSDNPLQGTPPDGPVSNNEPSGPSSPNQEELDLPKFDASPFSGQPRNDPKRDYPNQ